MQWLNVTYTPFDLLLITLAALYAASVLTSKDGPFYVFRKLRDATRRHMGGLFDCIWCTVFWVALLFVAIHAYAPVVTWVFAVAGAAMAVRSYSGVQHG